MKNLKLIVQAEFIVMIAVETQLEKKIIGGKCSICGYNKCVEALKFHHENPEEKEFKLGSGNTMSWKDYKAEVQKCILVCSNCHKEIHCEIGYK